MNTAVLIDAAFFLNRYTRLVGSQAPDKVADDLHRFALAHMKNRDGAVVADLYRIFVYDCPPLSKKLHNPISRQSIDLSKTDEFIFRTAFHDALRTKRKVALRLGRLTDVEGWTLRPQVARRLLTSGKSEALSPDDVHYQIRQKGVDMKIGLDVASMAFKKQVQQIVLFTGDSDFVPVAKLARREGIDFILDPMWTPLPPDLNEHTDGLRSTCPKPKRKRNGADADGDH